MWIDKSIECTRSIEKLINENINHDIVRRFKAEGYDVNIATVTNDIHEVLYYEFRFCKRNTQTFDGYYLFTIRIDNNEIRKFVSKEDLYYDRNNIIEIILFEKLKLKEIIISGISDDDYIYLLDKYKN